jgi:hypothetical protein
MASGLVYLHYPSQSNLASLLSSLRSPVHAWVDSAGAPRSLPDTILQREPALDDRVSYPDDNIDTK